MICGGFIAKYTNEVKGYITELEKLEEATSILTKIKTINTITMVLAIVIVVVSTILWFTQLWKDCTSRTRKEDEMLAKREDEKIFINQSYSGVADEPMPNVIFG